MKKLANRLRKTQLINFSQKFLSKSPLINNLENQFPKHTDFLQASNVHFCTKSFSVSQVDFLSEKNQDLHSENEQGEEDDEENEKVFTPVRRKNAYHQIKYFFISFAVVFTYYLYRYGYIRKWIKTIKDGKESEKTLKQQFEDYLKENYNRWNEPISTKQLPDLPENQRVKPVLVISVENILLHREYTPETGVRFRKRKGMEEFLVNISKYFEVVLMSKYTMNQARGILHAVDKRRVAHKLFAEHLRKGKKKDLKLLNRPIEKIVLLDYDKTQYSLFPENTIVVRKWDGEHDKELLLKIQPMLEYLGKKGLKIKTDVRKELVNLEREKGVKRMIKKFEEMDEKEKEIEDIRKVKGFPGKKVGIWKYL